MEPEGDAGVEPDASMTVTAWVLGDGVRTAIVAVGAWPVTLTWTDASLKARERSVATTRTPWVPGSSKERVSVSPFSFAGLPSTYHASATESWGSGSSTLAVNVTGSPGETCGWSAARVTVGGRFGCAACTCTDAEAVPESKPSSTVTVTVCSPSLWKVHESEELS